MSSRDDDDDDDPLRRCHRRCRLHCGLWPSWTPAANCKDKDKFYYTTSAGVQCLPRKDATLSTVAVHVVCMTMQRPRTRLGGVSRGGSVYLPCQG